MESKLYSSESVAGATVWITGATAGIGEACAWRFAEGGARIVLIGRRNERLDALDAALTEAYPSMPKPFCLALDVQDIKRIENVMTELPVEYVKPDILVNNAGLALGVNAAWSNNMCVAACPACPFLRPRAQTAAQPPSLRRRDEVQTMLATNVTGLIAFTTAVLPGMRARGRGHIINVGSIAGHESYATGSIYCATKRVPPTAPPPAPPHG